jgi:AcrR family transcriptional regulator
MNGVYLEVGDERCQSRGVPRAKKSRKVGQHHGDLRAALLAAALEILEQGAAETLTLREVARRAGVSAAAPYNHFADKSALLAAVAVDGFEKLGTELAQAVARAHATERLGRMVATYVRFASEHASHYRVMFGPDMLVAEAAEPARQAALLAFERLRDGVARANPALDADSAAREALLAWALSHGAVELINGGLLEGLHPGLRTETFAKWVGAASARLVATAT